MKSALGIRSETNENVTCLKARGKMTLLLKLSLKKITSFCLVNRLRILWRASYMLYVSEAKQMRMFTYLLIKKSYHFVVLTDYEACVKHHILFYVSEAKQMRMFTCLKVRGKMTLSLKWIK